MMQNKSKETRRKKKTNTDKQLTDCLTESLKDEKFAKTQQMMCGWHCLTKSLTLCETSLHFIVTSFKRECAGMCPGAQLMPLSGVCRIWCTQLSLSCARLWD